VEEIQQKIMMYDRKPYEIINQGNNTISVKTEYSRWLVTKFKKMGGKWDKKEKVWKLKNVQVQEMEKLLDDYYDKSIVELKFNAGVEINGYSYEFCNIDIFKASRDEYGRIEQIKLAKDVTLIEEELPIYRGPRKGNGSLIFNTSCKIRVEIPKFLLDSENSDFEYGSFKIIE
jgi:hypothetical protein